MTQEHDPVGFASALSGKLASRSRHTCVLLGAGAACAAGLPDVAGLQEKVLAGLPPHRQQQLSRLLEGRNLEEALSRLRRIHALVSGDEAVDGLTADDAQNLDLSVCSSIVAALSGAAVNLDAFYRFASWVSRANYRRPVEIFTVNYDLLIERGLEAMQVPYFDGFVGVLEAQFRPDLVDAVAPDDEGSFPPFVVRLWKLHGSINWFRQSRGTMTRLGQPIAEGAAAAIYPSDAKYEESRRVPFVVLQDRFRRALLEPETIALVSGYSFNDSHLDDLLFEAATRRQRSEIVAFCYADIPTKLAAHAGMTPNLQVVAPDEAILGGVRAKWKAPGAAADLIWSGESFGLSDFSNLARFLGRSANQERGRDRIQDLLDQVLQVRKEGGE